MLSSVARSPRAGRRGTSAWRTRADGWSRVEWDTGHPTARRPGGAQIPRLPRPSPQVR